MTGASAGAAAASSLGGALAGGKSSDAGAPAAIATAGNAGRGGGMSSGGVTSAGVAGTTSGSSFVADGGAGGAGGAGGTGGDASLPITCDSAPVPLKGSWKASASHSSLGAGLEFYNPPEYVMDLSSKRWSTGKPQGGDEWLQIDFGAETAIRELSFTLNPDDADDYPRIYQIQISDTPLDFDGTIRASGAGLQGQTLVVTLAEPVVGRYLLVQQKGKDPANWWSVSELTATCF